jgi:hypothetical protein
MENDHVIRDVDTVEEYEEVLSSKIRR